MTVKQKARAVALFAGAVGAAFLIGRYQGAMAQQVTIGRRV